MTLPIHGTMRSAICRRILVVEDTGPFNVEYWVRAREIVWPQIEALDASGPFAILIMFHRSVLLTPEAMELILERNTGFAAAHPRCAAIAMCVAPNVEARTVLVDLAHRYFAVLGVPAGTTELFENEKDAVEFLTAILATKGVR